MREFVVYHRYETAAELALLNEIWELKPVFANYLLQQEKLLFKQCNGAKVTKRYSSATSPNSSPSATRTSVRCQEF